MAFMGIFLMFLMIGVVALAIILAILITGIVINLIITMVLYSGYTKKMKAYKADGGVNTKKPIPVFWVFAVITMLFYLPMPLTVAGLIYQGATNEAELARDLAYNVKRNNYAVVKRLLEKGEDPDICSDTNEKAKPGEKTLLYSLAENGFTDNFGHPKSDTDVDDEIRMMQLLIDYGADIEWVYEGEGNDHSWHIVEDEYSYYRGSDGCGSTPFLAAVRNGNVETVELLIENGADVNAVDYCGYNAALIAADSLNDSNGGPEILKLLLEEDVSFHTLSNFEQSMEFLIYRHNWFNEEMVRIFEKNY